MSQAAMLMQQQEQQQQRQQQQQQQQWLRQHGSTISSGNGGFISPGWELNGSLPANPHRGAVVQAQTQSSGSPMSFHNVDSGEVPTLRGSLAATLQSMQPVAMPRAMNGMDDVTLPQLNSDKGSHGTHPVLSSSEAGHGDAVAGDESAPSWGAHILDGEFQSDSAPSPAFAATGAPPSGDFVCSCGSLQAGEAGEQHLNTRDDWEAGMLAKLPNATQREEVRMPRRMRLSPGNIEDSRLKQQQLVPGGANPFSRRLPFRPMVDINEDASMPPPIKFDSCMEPLSPAALFQRPTLGERSSMGERRSDVSAGARLSWADEDPED